MKKLYIIVRADLEPGMQLAQACHATRQFAAEHPELDRTWFETSNNLVALQVANEQALLDLIERANGLPVAPFREPDLGNEVTAVAMGSSASPLLGQMPLALRPPVLQPQAG
jgi:peptidyl-tRNA hydrolase